MFAGQWHSIDSAPKDGRPLHVKREEAGATIAEGKAFFGDVDSSDPGRRRNGVWIDCELMPQLFPEPTHWRR